MQDDQIAARATGRAGQPLRWRFDLTDFDWIGRMSEWPFMISLRRSLLLTLPLVLFGAFAHFINALTTFGALEPLFGGWHELIAATCATIVNATFGLVALVVVLGFPYALISISAGTVCRVPVSPVAGAIVVLSAYVLVMAPADLVAWKDAFSSEHGLPTALVVSIPASYLFLFLATHCGLRISVRGLGDDPLVGQVMSILPAAAVTLLVFAGIRQVQLAAGLPDAAATMSQLVSAPFLGAETSAGFVAAFSIVAQVFWFLGAHGASLLAAVQDQMMTPASNANFEAFAAGVEPVHIVTRQFFTLYTRFGGSGATLSLVMALLIADREPSVRRLALLALLPALINVNEPLVFGLPLILNPIYAVPFILTPAITAVIAYALTAADVVPMIVHPVPWTMPVFASGIIGTGSLMGGLVQLALLAVGTAIYLPFVQAAARLRLATNRKALRTLLVASEESEAGVAVHRLLGLPGHAGRLANTLALDLAEVLERSDGLYLEYQPQIFIEEKRVFGVEALLRWNHEVYGMIPPPVTVALAEDTRSIALLGEHVLRLASRQRVAWNGFVPDDLIVSVNVSPRQLPHDDFDLRVLEIIAEEGLPPHLLELEITESTALLPAVQAVTALHRLRAAGVRIALDDFGMGHTSLHYLRELPLNTLKIDRSLTFASQGDLNEHVIRSIVDLSRTLGIVAVVEGIEQPEQLPRFINLGCNRFQGYLFSRPLRSGPCLDYIRANTGNG